MAVGEKILIGVIPTGTDVHLFGEDIAAAARMLDDAHRRADLARAEAERVRLSAIADIERTKSTRKARAARRFKRALKMFARLK